MSKWFPLIRMRRKQSEGRKPDDRITHVAELGNSKQTGSNNPEPFERQDHEDVGLRDNVALPKEIRRLLGQLLSYAGTQKAQLNIYYHHHLAQDSSYCNYLCRTLDFLDDYCNRESSMISSLINRSSTGSS